MKMKTNSNPNKKLVPLALTLIVALVTMTLCLISSAGAPLPSLFKANANTQYPILTDHIAPLDDRDITWDEQINSIETTNGTTDYVVFGEAPGAWGGAPPDSYDVAKPPAPIEPYTRVWLNDNLPVPYSKLWKDYRYWSSLNVKKTWNLTVQWVPINVEKYPTTSLTLSWDTDGLIDSEYDKIVLYEYIVIGSSYVLLVPDMVTTTSYQYTAAAEVSRYFRINCTVDTKPPQIINHSPGTGETGDPFTFNAEVFDDMTPTSSLIVKVNWAHGSLSSNDTMTYSGGNFVKTITLDEYSTNDLTYHFYAKDNAKVPNANYTSGFTASISDNDLPSIDSITGNTVGTTGETTTISATFSDNIGVTVATLYYKTASAGSYSSTSILSGSAGIAIPLNSIESWYYYVTVDDAAGTGPVGNPSVDGSVYYTVTVSDNDAPQITNIVATPASQLVNNYVNVTATITDNINLNTVKVNISGPTGFTNASMIKDGGDKYFYNISYTLVGTYNYYIWAKDTSNNGIKSSMYQFEIFAELQITTLKIGWNFVSVPFNLTVPKTNLFIKSGVTRYTWGEAVANHIIINATYNWTENQPQQHYNLTNALKPGKGYWLYAYSECELWATNLTPITSTDFITSMINKWNIVGVPIGTSVSKASLIVRYNGVNYTWANAVTNGYVVKDIFGWSRTVPQGYFIADVLDPGYCYWIYAYVDCILKRTV